MRRGVFRRYGAFRIGGAIVAQHVLRGTGWMVKSAQGRVEAASAAEELTFVRNNADRDALLRVCDAARLQFGRVDHDRRADRLVIFGINPKPTFPDLRGRGDPRAERRGLITERLREAVAAIDSAGVGRAGSEALPTVRCAALSGWTAGAGPRGSGPGCGFCGVTVARGWRWVIPA